MSVVTETDSQHPLQQALISIVITIHVSNHIFNKFYALNTFFTSIFVSVNAGLTPYPVAACSAEMIILSPLLTLAPALPRSQVKQVE